MKANIIYYLGAVAVIVYGLYSIFAYPAGEREQGFFLVPFGLVILGLVYVSTRDRRGK